MVELRFRGFLFSRFDRLGEVVDKRFAAVLDSVGDLTELELEGVNALLKRGVLHTKRLFGGLGRF